MKIIRTWAGYRERGIESRRQTADSQGCVANARKWRLERVKGIEPSYAAWEAAVLPLNYTRKRVWDCRMSILCLQAQERVIAVRDAKSISASAPEMGIVRNPNRPAHKSLHRSEGVLVGARPFSRSLSDADHHQRGAWNQFRGDDLLGEQTIGRIRSKDRCPG